jgi:hypothetical protein
VYQKIKDDPREFDLQAKQQVSPSLNVNEGRIPPFGRNALGDPVLEAEAFRLNPGDMSALVGTAQGLVLIKCDAVIPPDTTKRLDQERAKLTEEVLAKKVQIEMQKAFVGLREKAGARLLLKGPNTPIDLAAETRALLRDASPLAGQGPRAMPAASVPGPGR